MIGTVVIPNYGGTLNEVQTALQVAALDVVSVEKLPLPEAVLTLDFDIELEFTESGQSREVEVPIPNLPNLDELEIGGLGFHLASREYLDDVSVDASSVASEGLTVTHSAGAPNLETIEIEGLSVSAPTGTEYVLANTDYSGSVSNFTYRGDGDSLITEYLHFLIRPINGTTVNPPIAGAPHFDMPGRDGAPSTMYGPALAGAWVKLWNGSGGSKNATISLYPPVAAGSLKLILGSAGETHAHGGLPSNVTSVNWSASNVRCIFDLRPTQITVTAKTGSSDDTPLVAQFGADPGASPVHVDFAPVAGSLANSAYPQTQGSDLGLKLVFTSEGKGALGVNLGQAIARYLYRPVGEVVPALELRGAPETLELPVPAGLRPSGMSFTVDGIYGPIRLADSADTTPDGSRRGFRTGGGICMARRVALTQAERQLPLARVALYGRSGEPCELLISIHTGDDMRIGPRLGEPMSIEIEPSSVPEWYRINTSMGIKLPPYPEAVWVVAHAPKGTFWWHGDPEAGGIVQRSTDDGGTWTAATGRPLLQLCVREVDRTTGNPHPLYPLKLSWTGGVLNNDIVGVPAPQEIMPPEFRRFWIMKGENNVPFVDGIAALDTPLYLEFSCRRDVEMHLSNILFTYDPWTAGEI